jgi:hypothetical protein
MVNPDCVEFLTGVNERGYGAPRKKGKPLSKKLVRKELVERSHTKIVVTGPDFVGCTTLLQLLGRSLGLATLTAPRPAAATRGDFDQGYFDSLVTRWAEVCRRPEVVLVEESPWSYLAKHSTHVTPQTRSACHAVLAQLVLPDLTFALHTSGVSVGRRHPLHRHQPEQYSPTALAQMSALQFLPQPCIFVDATVDAVAVAQRVTTVLNTKVFRAEKAEIEGMGHLLAANPSHSREECGALAAQLHLARYDLGPEGQSRLARLANIIEANPDIVNQALQPKERGHYF